MGGSTQVIDFTSRVSEPAGLDVAWIHGSPSAKHNTDPDIQVHAYDAHTVILRQNMAGDYEGVRGPDLEGFIAFCQEQADLASREGEAVTAGENENAIVLMTTHAAKGLEFDVVVLADWGRQRGARQVADILVNMDVEALASELKTMFPGSKIQVSAMNGAIALRGQVPDLKTAEQAVKSPAYAIPPRGRCWA